MTTLLYDSRTEKAAVQAALVEPENFRNHIDPDDIFDAHWRAVWIAGRNLVTSGRPVTDSVLADELERMGVERPALLLLELRKEYESPEYLPAYAKRISDLARFREYRAVMSLASLATAEGPAPDVRHMIDATVEQLGRLRAKSRASDTEAGPATGWSAAELLAADFREPIWAVPGFVPVGLTILGGRPKIGKSWLALQIAIAKGTGGRVFNRRVTAGRVLYLALEDNGRRLRDRALKQGMPAAATIRFETAWPRLTQGGLDLLARAIDAEGYAFVVLDTIGRAVGRLDRNDYGDNTELMGALQEIALSRDIAVLILDHTRKPIAGLLADPVDDIIGSTGKSGAADAVLSLTKSQGTPGAVLSITGRDVIQESYALSLDAVTCCWQLEGSAEKTAPRGRKSDVLAILRDAYPEAARTSEIAQMSGLIQSNLSPILNGLMADKWVLEHKMGRAKAYSLTPEGLRQVGGPLEDRPGAEDDGD